MTDARDWEEPTTRISKHRKKPKILLPRVAEFTTGHIQCEVWEGDIKLD